MKAKEIAQLLARDAEGMCRFLLPDGKREGKEWKAGSTAGESGKSLGVRLTGEKAGIWKDFATGESGDLLDLWAASKGISIGEALRDAKDHLGVRPQTFTGGERSYTRPEKPKVSKPKNAELEYLTAERKLSKGAIEAYRLASRDGEIVFPHIRDDELVAVKYMRTSGEKSKKWRWEKGCEPCLFGWQAIPADAREVVICEGHMDAPSWWDMGRPALSIPNGTSAMDWIEVDYEWLERFDTIWLAFDSDAPGQNAVPQVADRLGRERCRILDIPKPWKDGNDLLRSGFDALKACTLFEQARSLDPDELKHASYYEDEVLDLLTGKQVDLVGYRTPWSKVGQRFRFRRGELTILAGENFHGKSDACGHFTVDCLAQGALACVASLEYKPARWLRNITTQASAKSSEPMTRDYGQAVFDWIKRNLWVFDVSGAKVGSILEVFEYARRRYGIDLFVIDNLQKCGIADDDYAAQKIFAEKLSDFARDHDVHVILVHHVNKSSDEGPRHSSAIKGSGGITDMANNVIIWWRNRKKEREIEAAAGKPIDEDLLDQCDAMMIVEKQRETGDTPKVLLWFDKHCKQFKEKRDGRPKQYVRYSGEPEEAVRFE